MVAGLKVIEWVVGQWWLNAVIAAKEDFKGSRSSPQRNDIEGIIHRTKRLFRHLEDT